MTARESLSARPTWLAIAAFALFVAAWWLRTPTLITAGAFGIMAALALLLRRDHARGFWGKLLLLALVAMAGVMARDQYRLEALARDPVVAVRQIRADGLDRLRRETAEVLARLREAASEGLAAAAGPTADFRALRAASAPLERPGREGGVILLRNDAAIGWSGTLRTPFEHLQRGEGADFGGFYVVLYAVATRDSLRSVAIQLLHAESPADAVSSPFDAGVARQSGLAGFDIAPGPRSDGEWSTITVGTASLAVRPRAQVIGISRQDALERALLLGASVLAVALLSLLVLALQRPAGLLQRIAGLGAALWVMALVPLNGLSNAVRLFDASVYFAPLGGPYSASAAALALASALILVGFFVLQRSGARLLTRPAAVGVVILVAGLGPFLLRDLARGVTPPAHGTTTTLWLGWEIALFLAASATLLAGASAGRVALGRARGVGASVAPLLAAGSALAAPVLWEAPGRWPGWYPVPWILAMAALALTRRTRASVVSAAIVAACGAATLVFGATAKRRVELADGDVARLAAPDSTALQLLDRFARSLEIRTPPVEREELLQRYVHSDLASAAFPVELASWLPGASQPYAELNVAPFERPREAEWRAVDSARRARRSVVVVDTAVYGVQLVLATPHANGGATSVIVAPRSLLLPSDPFMSLAGLSAEPDPDPPYTVTLSMLDAPSGLAPVPRWQRKGTELHGDAAGGTSDRPGLVHVEVDLRGLDALVPRGALMIMLDLLLLTALWTLAASADGGMGRWLRVRWRRFLRSFRARLTLTAFSFFVVPAAIFALWSYQRLQSSDRQSRELLVRETLRGIEATGDPLALAYEGSRLRTPLFLYANGVLRATSDPLYERLAPVGRLLPPEVALRLQSGDETDASARLMVGAVPTLFGFRAAVGLGEGRGTVLAAPARANEVELDQQRRDLGVLVLFFVALGGIAALWLSGVAAEELGRPIGALQQAALRIARGGREGPMPPSPPAEFAPVFAAFQRMDEDLAAGRTALEAAQRRTEAVLRNVASGVVATDAAGVVVLANPRAEHALGARAVTPGLALGAALPTLGAQLTTFLEGMGAEAAFQLELRGREYRGFLTRLERSGGAVVTLDDVTELARAQRVLAWGEMARQVAHEIKNPLTPIRLGVQHLRRARADRRVDFERIFEQNIDRILAEIDRLDEIARNFSRYGTAPSERAASERVDVASILRDVVELERLGESEMSWSAEGESAALAMARGDELREVLLNVFENARQAGARTVRATVDAADAQVRVTIADDGPGIAPDVLPKVFDPHFSTRTSGSGLGLAISRTLVRAWGGDMTADSAPGEGTVVRITLTAAQ